MIARYYLDLWKEDKAQNRRAVEEGWLHFRDEKQLTPLMAGQERIKIVIDLPDRYFTESISTVVVPENQ